LARTLEIAPEGEVALRQRVRLALAGWAQQVQPFEFLSQQPGHIDTVAYSPDGKTFLTGSPGAQVQLWDVEKREPFGPPLRHNQGVSSIQFSPDGRLILTTCGAEAILWDVVTRQPRFPPFRHPGFVTVATFSPDGTAVLSGCVDGKARLWQTATGQLVLPLLEHEDRVEAVAVSNDGKLLLTGGRDDKGRLWEAETGKPLAVFAHEDDVMAVVFSPDDKTVVTASTDRTVRLWDVTTGRLRIPPLVHGQPVLRAWFVAGGDRLLTVSASMPQLWETATGKSLGFLNHPLNPRSWAFATSPDRQTIATSGLGNLVLFWSATTGQPIGCRLLPHGDHVTAVAYRPDGGQLLTGSWDKTLRLWRTPALPAVWQLPHDKPVEMVAVHPDGQRVLSGGFDGSARLSEIETGQLVGPVLRHSGTVVVVAFSPDAKKVLTAGLDRKARVWDVETGQLAGPVLAYNHGQPIAFSGDGQGIVAGQSPRQYGVWQIRSGIYLNRYGLLPDGWGSVAGLSPARDQILIASGDTARLHDLATGAPRGPALVNAGLVSCVAFRPDGKTLLTGCDNGALYLWDAATGVLNAQGRGPAGSLSQASFSRDGQWVLSRGVNNLCLLWEGTSGHFLFSVRLGCTGFAQRAAFCPDSGHILLVSGTTAQLWPLPAPVAGSTPRVLRSVQCLTGMELDLAGQERYLDEETSRKYRQELEQLGGSVF
jgi:WD40 repeat protein